MAKTITIWKIHIIDVKSMKAGDDFYLDKNDAIKAKRELEEIMQENVIVTLKEERLWI